MTDIPDFAINGRTFRARLELDECMGPPWEEHCGHGVVSEWTQRAKRPGEVAIAGDGPRGCPRRYYDIQESTKIARRDGWDAKPYGGTRGEKAARAVEADFERLRQWCEGHWCWVSLVVTPLCQCCGEPMEGEAQWLGGIEGDSGEDYFAGEARELAEEWLSQQRAAA